MLTEAFSELNSINLFIFLFSRWRGIDSSDQNGSREYLRATTFFSVSSGNNVLQRFFGLQRSPTVATMKTVVLQLLFTLYLTTPSLSVDDEWSRSLPLRDIHTQHGRAQSYPVNSFYNDEYFQPPKAYHSRWQDSKRHSRKYDSPWSNIGMDDDFKVAALKPYTTKENSDQNYIPEDNNEIKPNHRSIENSLAAIFKGVAYGVSPSQFSSTIETTTTEAPTKPVLLRKVPTTTFQPITTQMSPHTSSRTRNTDVSSYNEDVRAPHDSEHKLNEVSNISNGKDKNKDDIGKEENNEVRENELELALTIHVYCSAISFSILSLMSLLCALRVNASEYLLPTRYYICAHTLVFLASLLRSILFFSNPYALNSNLPSVVSDMLMEIEMPIISSALVVVILALLKISTLKILPDIIESNAFHITIIVAFLLSNILVDVFEYSSSNSGWSSVLRSSVHALTYAWVITICIGYMFIFYKIEKFVNQRNECELQKSCNSGMENRYFRSKKLDISLRRGARLTLVASLFAAILAMVKGYGLMTSKNFDRFPSSEPWMWLGYQTFCRLTEILLSSFILPAAALLLAIPNKTIPDFGMTMFSCKNCACCRDKDDKTSEHTNKDYYPPICQSDLTVKNFSVDLNGKITMQDRLPVVNIDVSDRNFNNHYSSPIVNYSNNFLPTYTMPSKKATILKYNTNGHVKFVTNENSEYQNSYGFDPGKNDHTYCEPDITLHSSLQMNKRLHENYMNQIGSGNPQKIYNESFIPSINSADKTEPYTNHYHTAYIQGRHSDLMLHDDYQGYSYYHSPINELKSTQESHSYAPLKASYSNKLARKAIKNIKDPCYDSCFSSPQSRNSSDQSSKIHSHHTSDSDLCSAATDQMHNSLNRNDSFQKCIDVSSCFNDPTVLKLKCEPESVAKEYLGYPPNKKQLQSFGDDELYAPLMEDVTVDDSSGLNIYQSNLTKRNSSSSRDNSNSSSKYAILTNVNDVYRNTATVDPKESSKSTSPYYCNELKNLNATVGISDNSTSSKNIS